MKQKKEHDYKEGQILLARIILDRLGEVPLKYSSIEQFRVVRVVGSCVLLDRSGWHLRSDVEVLEELPDDHK